MLTTGLRLRRATIGVVALAGVACGDEGAGGPPTGLDALTLHAVAPNVVVPGTTLVVEGASFLGEPFGRPWLRLSGSFDAQRVDVYVPAVFDDYDRLHAIADDALYVQLGGQRGAFEGVAMVVVDYLQDGSRHESPPVPMPMTFVDALDPVVDALRDAGEIYVNEPIAVEGSGLLLGGDEGETIAEVRGCFVPEGSDTCVELEPVEVPVTPDEPTDRTRGTFAFSPRIAGIRAGRFEGRVELRNAHEDGSIRTSDPRPVAYDLRETTIGTVDDAGRFARYVGVDGGGFIGGDDGLTLLRLEGTYHPDDGFEPVPVTALELVPEYVSGTQLRYVLDEDDALGVALEDLGGARYAQGTFEGTMRAIVRYFDEELVAPEAPVSLRLEPVRQVVWVIFTPTYVESLRQFGLRALDRAIRDRVFEVLARDYEGVAVEFREEEPTDYKWYTIVEIGGPDPNGRGLLGYDNTVGKDVGNDRLYDRIGGVNALVQQDDAPGYGGVFIESMFTFSTHPPVGGVSKVALPLFDEIFDPFRPDTGTPVSAQDDVGGGIPPLTSGAGCPSITRRAQAACAVWTLGSLIGTTTSHELGHSFGLAAPHGSPTQFHNLGDGEARLMDAGSERPFEERAELMGRGPSVFCDDEYEYLREILPSDDPPSDRARPGC